MADRRARILAAARQIIAEEGVEGLAMRKLAERAGVVVRTLYNLYGSREAILQALIDHSMDVLNQALEEAAPLDDPIGRCRAVVTVSVAQIISNEALSRATILARYQGLGEGGDAVSLNARAPGLQSVALRAGIGQGLFRADLDPDAIASQMYHGYHLAHVQWAYGIIDAEEFEARALYGVYLPLLGVATEPTRQRLLPEVTALEALLTKKAIARQQA